VKAQISLLERQRRPQADRVVLHDAESGGKGSASGDP
jgi:hypothetical protein